MSDIFETNNGGFPVKNASYWRRQAMNKDKEIESLRQRVAELEYAIGLQNVPAQTKDELAALKQSQGEPVAWEACCPGPIYAREVFKTKAEAESCSDAWDSCFITPLYTAPTIPKGKMLIETAFLKMVSESLGRFVSDEGWAQHDMDVMDDLDARIAAAPKPEDV